MWDDFLDTLLGQQECLVRGGGAAAQFVRPPAGIDRLATTAAPVPWRGVRMGVIVDQRSLRGSQASFSMNTPPALSPPKTKRRPASTAAATPLRAVGSGANERHASAAAS